MAMINEFSLTSDTVPPPDTLSFIAALWQMVHASAKIRCKHWSESAYLQVKNGRIVDENGFNILRISTELIMAEDWQIVPEWDS